MCTVIHCLSLQCLRDARGVHRFLPPALPWHVHSQWSWKANSMWHCPYFLSVWGATCNNMWQGQRNGPWQVEQKSQGSIMSLKTNKAIHLMVECNKEVLVGSLLSLASQRGVEMIALNLSPALGPIPHMVSINWMGMFLEWLCIWRHLT